ncbi:MAG TPA: lipocalin family protein [Caulobacter sp.]|nr:lipocalin family protein [Caulobacter sp.]
MIRRSFAALALTVLLAGCGGPVGNSAVPQPAKPVELQRYLGKWYELARYDNRFERGCEGVTAEYSLRPDGMVRVLNTCREGAPEGEARSAEGRAKVVEGSNGAKLKVAFFGPFFADYWVLDRADDYGWAIVGEPSGRYLWLLSRDPAPDAATMDSHRKRIAALGYDIRLLKIVRQPPATR